MTYRILVLILLAVAAVVPTPAKAQWGNYYNGPGGGLVDIGIPVQPANTYVAVQNNLPCVTATCVTFIPLLAFSPGAAIAGVQNQIVDLNNRVAAINSRLASMNSDLSRSFEIGAIAASMRDAIPNPGDRFAVRLNAAGFNGYAGGSLGVSMNITESARLSANYGRGATQNVVSGGLNISFR